MRFLKKRDVRFYLNAAACLIATVTATIYSVYALGNKTFVPAVVIMLFLGIVSSAIGIFKDVPFVPLASCVFWSLAAGLFISNRLMMFGDYINGLPGLSGAGNILELVIVLIILMISCVALEITVCFKRESNN